MNYRMQFLTVILITATIGICAMEQEAISQPESAPQPELPMIPTSALPVMQPSEPAASVTPSSEPAHDEIEALFRAIHNNNAQDVASILNKSSNQEKLANAHDKMGIAALREAATGGNSEIIQSLIRAGANPNPSDSYNITPLMMAALQGHKDAIFWLIKLGATINAQDRSGQTALDYARFGGNTTPAQKDEIIAMLKQYGAKEK